MAAKKPEGLKKDIDPKLRYAHMIVYLARRASLLSWCIGAGVLLGFVIFPVTSGLINNWLAILPVVAVVALATLMIPPTEEWEYSPWQAEPERYEHYTRD